MPPTSTRSTQPDILDEAATFLVGGGIIVMALFPFAVPIIALAAVIPIAAGLVGAGLALPLALVAVPIRLLRRRRRGARAADPYKTAAACLADHVRHDHATDGSSVA